MNLLIPRFSRPRFDALWRAVKGSFVAPFVSHEGDLPMAYDLARFEQKNKTIAVPSLADLYRMCFDRPLQGAGYAFESRRWLHSNAADSQVDAATNATVDYNIYDFFAVAIIGFHATVTITTTPIVVDFDLYPQLYAQGTAVDKLDGTNGVLTSPSTAAQTAGKFLFRDLGHDPGEIDVTPGQSIQAIIATAGAAGDGFPFVIGYARPEEFRNVSAGTRV